MAETLGMLCDKLTIVKLKQYHTDDETRLASLNKQAFNLQAEIDEYIADAIAGKIPVERMTFAANKVFKKEGNDVAAVTGNIAEVFSRLADVNCRLWHEQEKVYDFEKVPTHEKDQVVKQLALLNLERNQCIDNINNQFTTSIQSLNNKNR
ncbi:MAG TPA: hypothetical protein VK718_01650 [Ferruginibacter sp.]|jgi:hypothetical protein|nr:hypothetical protein [Ferruginibacter sp.]